MVRPAQDSAICAAVELLKHSGFDALAQAVTVLLLANGYSTSRIRGRPLVAIANSNLNTGAQPLESIAKLAALVPKPRTILTRFRGMLGGVATAVRWMLLRQGIGLMSS